MHQKTSVPTNNGQQATGFAASARLILAGIADLIAVVSLPVGGLEGKHWTTIALVAGPVGVLASLLYLLDPQTRGRRARPLVVVFLVAGAITTAWAAAWTAPASTPRPPAA